MCSCNGHILAALLYEFWISLVVNIVVTVLMVHVIASVLDQLDIATADVGLSHQMTAGTVPSDAPWPRKLEAAQNVIFCKEVFAQVRCHALFTLLSLFSDFNIL